MDDKQCLVSHDNELICGAKYGSLIVSRVKEPLEFVVLSFRRHFIVIG